MTKKVIIWHNPRCSKSRASYKLLEENNVDFEQRLYLKNPPTIEELTNLLNMLEMKPKELIRKREKIYKELGLKDISEDKELIRIMCEHPRLIERPIVVKGSKAALGRPTENVSELLGLS